jgi:hypothetical protein
MLDISSIFNDLNIKSEMAGPYLTSQEKNQVLDRLYNLQARLENMNSYENLAIVDSVINFVENYDRSLSEHTKKILNDILQQISKK